MNDSLPSVPVRAILSAVALALLVSLPASAQNSGPAAKLPASILAAFQQSYPKAVIKAADKETENGKTVWEIESTDQGQSRSIVYALDGTALTIEETVAIDTLPAAVTAAVTAKYPKATITLAEKTIEGGKTFYELTLKGAAVKSLELMPDGSPVSAAKK